MDDDHGYIDASALTLDEWLQLLFSGDDREFVDYDFPTLAQRDEYYATIRDRSEREVKQLLRFFLLPSTSLRTDDLAFEWYIASIKQAPEIHKRLSELEYYRRLYWYKATEGRSAPPWEGIRWVLDLLPHFPRAALVALDSYILAHAQQLPDGRLDGLSEAADLIRAKFIGVPGGASETAEFLQSLDARQFECLVERLYHEMGFSTYLTPPRRDGGRDIIATAGAIGRREHLLIECKRYRGSVGVAIARALLGIVSDEKATKGVLVTSGHFTPACVELAGRNSRLELIGGGDLILLLNEYLGPRWPTRIERLTAQSLREAETPLVP
jgi:restriction system protein